MKIEIEKERINYYKRMYILFELVKAMKNKEVVFMDRLENWKCIRGIGIQTVDFLRFRTMPTFRFFYQDYNIYISCAKYKYIPMFTCNLRKRGEETKEWFENLNIEDDISEYDLFLDFDYDREKPRKEFLEEVCLVYDLLVMNKVCFNIVPSSSSGYQIIIPGYVYDFHRDIENKRFVIPFYFVNEMIKRFNLKFLCNKGAGVYNKLRKCPYSLVYNNIVFPLRKFTGNDYNINVKHVTKNYQIKNRGLMIHNDYGDKQNRENFIKFCKNYYLIERWIK